MIMYISRVFYDIVKSLNYFFNSSTMAFAMYDSSHKAVGKYLCKFHSNSYFW